MQASTQVLTEKDLFLKELRSITAPAHKQLETTQLSQQIISDQLSLNDYESYLSKMQSVIEACEEKVFPLVSSVFPDLQQRIKSTLLKNDLAFISKKTEVSSAAEFKGFDGFLSTPYAVGCMYVIEGSTLGGKFIYKNVNARLSLDAEHGASYFNGYGSETGKLWTSFLDRFCEYALNCATQQEIFKGAQETFASMYDFLSESE